MRNLLRLCGRTLPDIKYVRSVATRILRPLHNRFAPGKDTADVLGFKMELDPAECVDSALWFTPRHYDRDERRYVERNVTSGVLLDVGSNVGFWSLFLASRFPASRVIAIEANPRTYQCLTRNIAINGFDNIVAIGCGVGRTAGSFPLYLNETGNRGGDTMSAEVGKGKSIDVPVRPLSDILREAHIERVAFMKIDIEGMEQDVFEDIRDNVERAGWPKAVCVETVFCPDLPRLLGDMGYVRVLSGRENHIYVRD